MEKKFALCLATLLLSVGAVVAQSDYVKAVEKWRLDEETNLLFGVLTRTTDHTMAMLPLDPIMKRWWAHMCDIMESNPDNSPVDVPLTRVFHMD